MVVKSTFADYCWPNSTWHWQRKVLTWKRLWGADKGSNVRLVRYQRGCCGAPWCVSRLLIVDVDYLCVMLRGLVVMWQHLVYITNTGCIQLIIWVMAGSWTYPLGMEILHGLCEGAENRWGLPLREALLKEDPVQQFPSSHQLHHHIHILPIIIHLQASQGHTQWGDPIDLLWPLITFPWLYLCSWCLMSMTQLSSYK